MNLRTTELQRRLNQMGKAERLNKALPVGTNTESLEKAHRGVGAVGEIRSWGGVKYQKQTGGAWHRAGKGAESHPLSSHHIESLRHIASGKDATMVPEKHIADLKEHGMLGKETDKYGNPDVTKKGHEAYRSLPSPDETRVDKRAGKGLSKKHDLDQHAVSALHKMNENRHDEISEKEWQSVEGHNDKFGPRSKQLYDEETGDVMPAGHDALAHDRLKNKAK